MRRLTSLPSTGLMLAEKPIQMGGASSEWRKSIFLFLFALMRIWVGTDRIRFLNIWVLVCLSPVAPGIGLRFSLAFWRRPLSPL